jgi:hypothetical protein
MGVWQGVAVMDSLMFQAGRPCPTLLRPARGPYSRFRDGLPAGWVACGRLLSILDTPRRTPMHQPRVELLLSPDFGQVQTRLAAFDAAAAGDLGGGA